jgi:ABC-type transport system involved in multi-copper enzyme maturation permease subunit
MTMDFPLAERELARRGKRPMTYLWRAAIAAALLLVAMAAIGSANAEGIGRILVVFATICQVGVVIFVAPLLSSRPIAEEKQNQTLGLLLMADLRGWDIYASKFIAILLEVLLLILTPLPVLAFAAFFGGISTPAMAAQVIFFCLAAITVTAIGLLASTVAATTTEAFLLSVGAMALWLGGTFFLDFWITQSFLGGPLGHSNIILLAIFPGWAMPWVAVALCIAITILSIAASLALLPRQAYDPAPKKERKQKKHRAKRWLPLSPAARILAADATGLIGGLRNPIIFIVATIALVALTCFPVIGDMLLLILFLYSAITMVNHFRDEGSLENLLTAPIEARHLTRAIISAVMARSLVFFPALMALGAPKWGLIRLLGSPSWSVDIYALAFMFILYLPFAFFQFVCITTFACTMGLQPERPIIQTIFAFMLTAFLYGATTFGALGLLSVLDGSLIPGPSSVNNFITITLFLLTFAIALGLAYAFLLFSSYPLLVDSLENATIYAKKRRN